MSDELHDRAERARERLIVAAREYLDLRGEPLAVDERRAAYDRFSRATHEAINAAANARLARH